MHMLGHRTRSCRSYASRSPCRRRRRLRIARLHSTPLNRSAERDRHCSSAPSQAGGSVASRCVDADSTATSPLRSRLRRILAAYTVNRLGTWFGLVALLVAVFDHTHSALAVAALLFAGQALPAFLVARRRRPRRGLSPSRRAERAVLVRGGRDRRARGRCCGTSGCRRCCCSRRSTGRRRWPPARCCARAGARRARVRSRYAPERTAGTDRSRTPSHRAAGDRKRHRRGRRARGRAQGERGAERRLLGHVRARAGARRRSWSPRRRARRRCSSTSARS